MTIQEQADLADGMQYNRAHEAEMKLRRMAADAAISRERPVYFPVVRPFAVPLDDPGRLPDAVPYHVVVVDLWAGLIDHDMRVLVAEAILRPQLRDAGWAV